MWDVDLTPENISLDSVESEPSNSTGTLHHSAVLAIVLLTAAPAPVPPSPVPSAHSSIPPTKPSMNYSLVTFNFILFLRSEPQVSLSFLLVIVAVAVAMLSIPMWYMLA